MLGRPSLSLWRKQRVQGSRLRLYDKAWNDKASTSGSVFCRFLRSIWIICFQSLPLAVRSVGTLTNTGLMGVVGGKRIWAWEVKFLDRSGTNLCEGIFQVYLHQSRTKVWRSKMIRYHCSPLLQTMTPMDRIVFCSDGIFSALLPLQRESWGYGLMGEYVRKAET